MEKINKESFQSILLSAGLTVLAAVLVSVSVCFMGTSAKGLLAPLSLSDSIQEQTLLLLTPPATDKTATDKTAIIKNQYQICQQIKIYYMQIGVNYYKYYYAFSMCSILFLTLLTLAGILVANSGWQTITLLPRTFLLTTMVISSIFYFLPNVMNSKENIQKNTEKVKEFERIQLRILSLCHEYSKATDKQKDSSITSNFNEIIQNYDFLTNIDNTLISKNPEETIKSIQK